MSDQAPDSNQTGLAKSPEPAGVQLSVEVRGYTREQLQEAEDQARADGYHDGFIEGIETANEWRRDVLEITGRLRAGILTELGAIQELERIAQAVLPR